MENNKTQNTGDFKIFDAAKTLMNSPAAIFEKENNDYATDPKLCEKAFKKLCELWNKNLKSRNFVIHLCVAFTPYNQFNKVSKFDCEKDVKSTPDAVIYPEHFHAAECALLGIKMVGLLRLASELTRFSFAKMKIELESNSDKLSDSQVQRIKQLWKDMPIEVKSKSFGYFSEKSDKFISSAAMTAILRFIPEMIIRDCPELRYAINKNRIQTINSEVPEEKRLNPKQINKVAKASTFNITNHLDNGTIAALKGLKAAFEESEK